MAAAPTLRPHSTALTSPSVPRVSKCDWPQWRRGTTSTGASVGRAARGRCDSGVTTGTRCSSGAPSTSVGAPRHAASASRERASSPAGGDSIHERNSLATQLAAAKVHVSVPSWSVCTAAPQPWNVACLFSGGAASHAIISVSRSGQRSGGAPSAGAVKVDCSANPSSSLLLPPAAAPHSRSPAAPGPVVVQLPGHRRRTPPAQYAPTGHGAHTTAPALLPVMSVDVGVQPSTQRVASQPPATYAYPAAGGGHCAHDVSAAAAHGTTAHPTGHAPTRHARQVVPPRKNPGSQPPPEAAACRGTSRRTRNG